MWIKLEVCRMSSGGLGLKSKTRNYNREDLQTENESTPVTNESDRGIRTDSSMETVTLATSTSELYDNQQQCIDKPEEVDSHGDSGSSLHSSRRSTRGSLCSHALTEVTLFALLKPLDVNCNGSILKRDLVTSLRSNGLGKRHPGMQQLYKAIEEYDGESGEIPINVLVTLVTTYSQELVLNALQGRMVIPDFGYFTTEISEIAERVMKNTTHGKVTTSLPELASVADSNFAVSITTVTGQMFSFGDATERFCLQSVSKVLTYCEALKAHGADVVHDHVGREPSGTSFNAMSLKRHPRRSHNVTTGSNHTGVHTSDSAGAELNDEDDEDHEGGHASSASEVRIPHNPYINAGAILCSTLMSPGEEQHARIGNYLKAWAQCCGSVVGFDPCVQVADMADADRNNALCYMMREGHAFLDDDVNVRAAIEIYCATRAVTCTAIQLATAAATLANGGTNPLTQEQYVEKRMCTGDVERRSVADSSLPGDYVYDNSVLIALCILGFCVEGLSAHRCVAALRSGGVQESVRWE